MTILEIYDHSQDANDEVYLKLEKRSDSESIYLRAVERNGNNIDHGIILSIRNGEIHMHPQLNPGLGIKIGEDEGSAKINYYDDLLQLTRNAVDRLERELKESNDSLGFYHTQMAMASSRTESLERDLGIVKTAMSKSNDMIKEYKQILDSIVSILYKNRFETTPSNYVEIYGLAKKGLNI